MNSIQQMIREAHRRSLWQVLGVFLAASWGVLQVVETITESIGLPDWTPGMAFVLLLLGLPVVLATAFVQEGVSSAADSDVPASADGGTGGEGQRDGAAAPVNLASGTGSLDRPSTRPSRAARLLTWKHAVLGGVGAFALLGFSLVAYFVMWTTGVGPVGNLNAQGVFDDGETVVLADFENRSSDAGLGGVVTEALRVDLASSSAISLLAAPRIAELLSLMQTDPADGLSAETARELAIRGGVKAVIEGDVGSAGSGYIFTAAIRASESGEILATARRSADSAEDVIAAIDGLSQDIRERAGESLSSIKSGEGLDQVTTSSLEALRLYAEASALGERGEDDDAKVRLEQALELDPDFAMAWRELAIALQGAEAAPGEIEAATTRAYELRDRLTPRERGYTIALYHNNVTRDQEAGRRAYADLLEDYPDDPIALNNIAITYAERGRFEEAVEYLNRAVDGPGRTGTALFNLVYYLSAIGRSGVAHPFIAEMFEEYPGRSPWNLTIGSWVELLLGNQEEGVALASELETLPGVASSWRNNGTALHFVAAGLRGDWAAGEERVLEALDRVGRSGDAHEHAQLAARIAGWKIVAQADTAGALELLESAVVESFPEIPALARPYDHYIELFVMLGELDRAAALLEEWESTVGPDVARVVDEGRITVDVPDRRDRGQRIDAFRRYQSTTGCFRCYAWTLSELLEAEGRFSEAAEAVEVARAGMQNTELWPMWPPMTYVGAERLGRLYEELGDPVRAAQEYRTFAESFTDPDPGVAARVGRALARAEALESN